MSSYFINQDSCWITPVCVEQASACPISITSFKLAVRGTCGKVLAVLVADGTVVFEAAFDSPAAVLRFVTPPHILQSTGLLTVYVALCGEDGRIKEIVDSGKVLVFPKDAATEVRSVFSKTSTDVQRFFNTGQPEQHQQARPGTQHCDHSHQRPQQRDQQIQKQSTYGPALRQALQRMLFRHWSQPQPRITDHADSIGSCLSSTQAAAASATAQASVAGTPCSSASNNSSGTFVGIDASTLYAYEQFLLPFNRHWASVLQTRRTALQSAPVSSMESATVDELAVRLLHFMVENEMWASAVLLLDKYPTVADQVASSGLELPSDFCNPLILERLRTSLPPMPPVVPMLQPMQLQYAILQHHQQQHATASVHPQQHSSGDQASIDPAMLQGVDSNYARYAAAESDVSSPSGFSTDVSSYESASEILRRLMALQQRRSEQEALEHEAAEHRLSAAQEAMHHMQQVAVSDSHYVEPLSQAASSETLDAAVAAAEQLAAAKPTTEYSMQCVASSIAGLWEHSSDVGDSTKGLEGCFAVASTTCDSATEQLAMVPKDQPPRPLYQSLERNSSRGSAAPAVANSCVGSESSGGSGAAGLGICMPQLRLNQSGSGTTLMQQVSVAAAQSACSVASVVQAPSQSDASSAAAVAQPAKTADTKRAEASMAGSAQTTFSSTNLQTSNTQMCSSNTKASAACNDISDWTTDDGCCKSKINSSSGKQVEWDSCSRPSRVAAPQMERPLKEQLLIPLQATIVGFNDTCVERSYVVFKNHSAGVLDTTALFICSGMLLATMARSVDFSHDPACWAKLALLMAYGVAFFFPYALMQCRRQLFLRNRGLLFAIARSLAAFIVVLVALGRAPQPNAWLNVVDNTVAMQLQHGFILPSCQQVRLPAAVAIAVAHLPADMLMLALAQPMSTAFMHSAVVQLLSVLIALVLDAWCRYRFMRRYLGVAGDVQARPAVKQAGGPAAEGSSSCLGGGKDAVLRHRSWQAVQGKF